MHSKATLFLGHYKIFFVLACICMTSNVKNTNKYIHNTHVFWQSSIMWSQLHMSKKYFFSNLCKLLLKFNKNLTKVGLYSFMYLKVVKRYIGCERLHSTAWQWHEMNITNHKCNTLSCLNPEAFLNYWAKNLAFSYIIQRTNFYGRTMKIQEIIKVHIKWNVQLVF